MSSTPDVAPDSTAARVALWRALHVEVDPPPHVINDTIGLRLLAPDDDWRRRSDMDPEFTRPFRASIVARARFIDDLVEEQVRRGVTQYIILGAGLDSFAQRRPDLTSRLTVFEVDQPGPQLWKHQRLVKLGFGVPDWLRFVSTDFATAESWDHNLAGAGFDYGRPALAANGARASGTPFLSFFTPPEMLTLAREAGLADATHVSAADLARRYFAARTDGLRPPNNAEEFLLAST